MFWFWSWTSNASGGEPWQRQPLLVQHSRDGYRLIYFVDLEKSLIVPLLFHYKPDIALIPPKEIAKALKTILDKQAQAQAQASETPPSGSSN